MSLLARHYAEAEYHQDHLLPKDRQLILHTQDVVELLGQALTRGQETACRELIDLNIKALSTQMNIDYPVANALVCLELPEEVSK